MHIYIYRYRCYRYMHVTVFFFCFSLCGTSPGPGGFECGQPLPQGTWWFTHRFRKNMEKPHGNRRQLHDQASCKKEYHDSPVRITSWAQKKTNVSKKCFWKCFVWRGIRSKALMAFVWIWRADTFLQRFLWSFWLLFDDIGITCLKSSKTILVLTHWHPWFWVSHFFLKKHLTSQQPGFIHFDSLCQLISACAKSNAVDRAEPES